jgi:hypothetical protein
MLHVGLLSHATLALGMFNLWDCLSAPISLQTVLSLEEHWTLCPVDTLPVYFLDKTDKLHEPVSLIATFTR